MHVSPQYVMPGLRVSGSSSEPQATVASLLLKYSNLFPAADLQAHFTLNTFAFTFLFFGEKMRNFFYHKAFHKEVFTSPFYSQSQEFFGGKEKKPLMIA